jgi:hypothetical protein
MTDTRYFKQRKPVLSLYLPKGTPRPCRDFMARTTFVVSRATSSVSRLLDVDLPQFCPSRIRTCSDLLKQVKEFISQEVSDSQEVQFAFQSIKKLLPASCKCLKHGMLDDLRQRLLRPPPDLPMGYLPFVRKISAEIFQRGWDYSWETKVDTFSPSLGSCVGISRSKGGQLADLAPNGQLKWQESLNQSLPDSLEGELLLVDSAGKPRALTRFPSSASALRPLHGLIYDHISKNDWLCRGEVSDNLAKGGFVKGEPLTSGDYKSASDNLSIEVAETILDVAWSSSKKVPASVFRFALAAQRPSLSYEDSDGLSDTFVPTRGQMMGSYLCFPLLCLQNYIAFRYAEHVAGVSGTPVLINGDDILFQSSKSFSDVWMSVVGGLGLEVEKTKTSVDTEYGSLNSTLVRWNKDNRLFVVPTLRLGMLRECSHPGNLGTSAVKFSRVGPRNTWLRNFCEFLSWHERTIVKWRCVASDMGFTGRLALRAWERFRGGRLLWRDDVLHQKRVDRLPSAHCPHNIVMASEDFVNVPEFEVSKEISRDTSLWMSSKKWELGAQFSVIREPKAVSQRANATGITGLSVYYRTGARELKEEASRLMRRREYYANPDKRPLQDQLLLCAGFEVPDRCVVASREVRQERRWWRARIARDGVRIPKEVWYKYHPLPDLMSRSTDIVRDLLTGSGEKFDSFMGLKLLSGMRA